MNRFEKSVGYFLITTALLGMTVGGCPGIGGDGTSVDENTNENSQSERVVNSAPIASAGEDQTVKAGALAVLDGSDTRDVDADRLQFLWAQIGGSPTVVLEDGFSSVPRFFAPEVTTPTVLMFRLTVGDGQAISFDDVLITITP